MRDTDADEPACPPEVPFFAPTRPPLRANAGLDRASEEVEATKAYFAVKRGGAGAEAAASDARPRTPGSLPPPSRR